tara:strand:- start:328 stop:549 length:222 start_codon:yes stop_codon:yes gene_type:complete
MQNSIQLQSVGLVNGTQAGEIKVGTTLLWNFGATSVVKSISKETNKSIWFITETENGNTYNRRFLKTRIIGTL